MLGQVVNNANGSILDKVVVVLGRSAAEVKKSLSFGRAIVVDNAAYPSGCASSLLAGLDAAGDCAGLMLLLGDQPGVGSEIVDLVAEEWLGHRSWVVVTSYRGELGHPFVFARSAFDDLRGLHGDKAIWKLIEAYPQRVRRVEVDLDLTPGHRHTGKTTESCWPTGERPIRPLRRTEVLDFLRSSGVTSGSSTPSRGSVRVDGSCDDGGSSLPDRRKSPRRLRKVPRPSIRFVA